MAQKVSAASVFSTAVVGPPGHTVADVAGHTRPASEGHVLSTVLAPEKKLLDFVLKSVMRRLFSWQRASLLSRSSFGQFWERATRADRRDCKDGRSVRRPGSTDRTEEAGVA